MTEKHKPQDFFTTILNIGFSREFDLMEICYNPYKKSLQLGEISFTLNTAQQN